MVAAASPPDMTAVGEPSAAHYRRISISNRHLSIQRVRTYLGAAPRTSCLGRCSPGHWLAKELHLGGAGWF